MQINDRRTAMFGALAAILVTVTTAASVLWGERWPALVPLNALVCWAIGKLLGVPIEAVTSAAVGAMRSDKAIQLTVKAVQSMPPARAQEVTHGVLERIAAHAVGAMPRDKAEQLTRGLLDQMPPADQNALLERIVFLSSTVPPPLDMPPAPPLDMPPAVARELHADEPIAPAIGALPLPPLDELDDTAPTTLRRNQ